VTTAEAERDEEVPDTTTTSTEPYPEPKPVPHPVRDFVASTPPLDEPHVVARWEDDRLVEVAASRLDGGRLTLVDMIECYKTARRMHACRRDVLA
jgi:hypothetical protein